VELTLLTVPEWLHLLHSRKIMSDRLPNIVIVGGGFAGLAAAKALRKAPVQITLIDRTNHHLFQPLLYQVAISVLSPGQIAAPIRDLMREQKNTTVLMEEVIRVDLETREIIANSKDKQGTRYSYDYLILATGARHSYFGHDEFAEHAPGLKNLADAVSIRNRILSAFERAELEDDPTRRSELMTFVLVGGGPAGVEMAGAIAVLARTTLKEGFRRIDPSTIRIVLVDGGKRVLGGFSEHLSAKAKEHLESLGVEVRSGVHVTGIDEEGVLIGEERITSKTVIWTAGVTPSPAGKWLGAPMDRAGRVRVLPDLSVPGHPEIFVTGDTASLDQDGTPLPGVAQVAIQQGHYVGKLIHSRITGGKAPKPFRYFDKGNMAVVGKGYAVLQTGSFQFSGFPAWLAWVFVHLQFLPQSGLRLMVFVQWMWTYITSQRGARLIIRHRPFEDDGENAHQDRMA
jgi:NADH:ubiquinone reductase (H+-translocating)